ncbi:hypothetical protein N7508_008309 [Penicillium antarcticum]|uniref:uncharacterized protein n=1 Tax=Penicillium antarcticum TaxID=416450 RepID=UPI0023832054|nr:uncharacterized protein N7508_008309 [Penicillium antarcticum]KAJ5298060.1 hypothetical protein N7508_008309 [Penicillium antarcticum]
MAYGQRHDIRSRPTENPSWDTRVSVPWDLGSRISQSRDHHGMPPSSQYALDEPSDFAQR